jgi:hypothetical protein
VRDDVIIVATHAEAWRKALCLSTDDPRLQGRLSSEGRMPEMFMDGIELVSMPYGVSPEELEQDFGRGRTYGPMPKSVVAKLRERLASSGFDLETGVTVFKEAAVDGYTVRQSK